VGDGAIIAVTARAGPTAERAATIAWSVVIATLVAWFVILWQVANPAPNRVLLGWGVWTLAFAGVATTGILLTVVGAVIVSRRPGNAVGWINVVGGIGVTIGCLGLAAGAQLLGNPNAPAFVQLAAFVSAAALQSSVAFFALVPLWFPDGPRSAGRARPLAILIPVAVGVRFLELFFQKGPDWLFPLYPSAAAPANPYEAGGLAGAIWDFDHPIALGWWLSGACVVLAGVALGLRFRKAGGAERRQLAWFVAAAVPVAPITVAFVYLLVALPPATTQADGLVALFFLGLALPTIATMIAITRYRLYEIDRIVNRAIVYSGLTAILATVFAITITLSEKALTTITGQSSDVAIVVTTLVVTGAYSPVRKALEKFVTRHVAYADPHFGPYRTELMQALETLDPHHAAGRLVREAVAEFRATSGAALLHLNGELRVSATAGRWSPVKPSSSCRWGRASSGSGSCISGPATASSPTARPTSRPSPLLPTSSHRRSSRPRRR
jgi:hypothetical protein